MHHNQGNALTRFKQPSGDSAPIMASPYIGLRLIVGICILLMVSSPYGHQKRTNIAHPSWAFLSASKGKPFHWSHTETAQRIAL